MPTKNKNINELIDENFMDKNKFSMTIENMVKDSKDFQMEICIKDNIRIIVLMVLELTTGSKGKLPMREVSKMDYVMVKENGLQDKPNIQELIVKA